MHKLEDQIISVQVPAKIHLLGEHAVVYGKPAILAAVGLYSHFRLQPHKRGVVISSKSLQLARQVPLTAIKSGYETAVKLWEQYASTNNSEILARITPELYSYISICIGETLNHYRMWSQTGGFEITVNSDVPIGAGLGSSACIAVGIAAALTKHLNIPREVADIGKIAFNCEKFRHGNPSGGDPATVISGGLVWFRKELADFKIIKKLPFELPSRLAGSFLLVDTGKPRESTGQMVSSVRKLYETDKIRVQSILDDQEELVKKLYGDLQSGEIKRVINTIRLGQVNLDKLEVVSEPVRKLIKSIENIGGAAKICGGGGKAQGTGIVLTIHPDKKILEKAISSNGYKYFNVPLGVSGIRLK